VAIKDIIIVIFKILF